MFHEVEDAASFYCENNYDLWKFLVELIIIFLKCFIVNVWQVSEYIFGFWISQRSECTCFWMYRSWEYARVLNMFLVQDMSGFWIYHGFKYSRITQGSEYAWIIPGYACLSLNVTKSFWKNFVLYLFIVKYYLKEP